MSSVEEAHAARAHAEYQKYKNAVEQIMEGKVQQRREAQRVFKKDMLQLINYTLFLLLFSAFLWTQKDPIQCGGRPHPSPPAYSPRAPAEPPGGPGAVGRDVSS
jgi:hypothetical protein